MQLKLFVMRSPKPISLPHENSLIYCCALIVANAPGLFISNCVEMIAVWRRSLDRNHDYLFALCRYNYGPACRHTSGFLFPEAWWASSASGHAEITDDGGGGGQEVVRSQCRAPRQSVTSLPTQPRLLGRAGGRCG